MSSWISNMRGFGRQSNKPQQNPMQQQRSSPGQPALSPSQSSLNDGPALSPSGTAENLMNPTASSQPRSPPFFFREQYANLIVKGNFMTLAAKPLLIEEGEWLAHQGKLLLDPHLFSSYGMTNSLVEQNRLMDGMLKIVQELDRNTGLPLCNQHTCPAMTAGPDVTYTWLDANRNAVRVPAPQYIAYVQRWITGKVTDQATFPTDSFSNNPPALTNNAADTQPWLGKPSGFPPSFGSDIRNIYRQMLRCYGHLYHNHWIEFWHLGAYKELNTCFIHFVNVGRIFGLISERDLEPMQPLIEIWVEKGWLPRVQSTSQGQLASGPQTPTSAQAQAPTQAASGASGPA